MTEQRSLLAFAPALTGPIPTGKPRFPPQPKGPEADRQGERLTPQFATLQAAMSAGRTQIAASTGEPDPELVVVFEIVGTVDRFFKAVAQIEGLEFLAELDEDAVEADEDFHYEEDQEPTDAAVPQSLYMVMSNAQAVSEMIRLFELWTNDPDVTFQRGLAPLKKAFSMLRAVRRWGPFDRVRETGLLEAWAEEVAVVRGQGFARVEIEFWFRESPIRRTAVQEDVQRLVADAGGSVINSAVVESIDYHALLADIPYDQVQAVLDDGPEAIALLTTESIMLVAPARPMMALPGEPADNLPHTLNLDSPPKAPPRVALLDGLPMANHDALAGRLIIDDPDDLEQRYSSGQHRHGTAMASLICHGDLAAPGPAMSTQLYVRPIMEPLEFHDGETVARDRLLVDVLHRAFRRIFDEDDGRPPVAPSVRIVNLSIGDPARVFARRVSPLAKLIDWLSHRYNVLVLISAGNHDHRPIVSIDAINDPDVLIREVLQGAHAAARHRRLLSPAEAVNVLTVGALHADSVEYAIPDTSLDVVPEGMPALYGAVGFGHRRSVKPEVLFPGGRQLFQRPPTGVADPVQLTYARHSATGPGVRVAAPDPGGGAAGSTYSRGTSDATALATRTASHAFDILDRIEAPRDEFQFPDAQYHPVLAKALVVNAASWKDLPETVRAALALDPRTARRDITQLLGYGPVDQERIGAATRTRAVLLGAGSISDGQRQGLNFPLPSALAATTEWRRLTVTLAWLSPINPRSQVHRMARLTMTPGHEKLGLDRREADHNAARRGTVQHEVFEGSEAVAFTTGDVLAINVDCRVDAGRLDAPIRYGVVASLEVATTVQADIHSQVRQLLRTQVQQRQQVVPRA